MRIVPVVLLILLAFSALSGLSSCSPGDVDESTAKEAFLYSLGGLMEARAALSLGREPEGATIDEETGVLRLERYRYLPSERGNEADQSPRANRYTSLSGTMHTSPSGVLATVDLSGGPVTRLAFELTHAQLLASDRVDVQVEADGRSFAVVVLPEDLR